MSLLVYRKFTAQETKLTYKQSDRSGMWEILKQLAWIL